MTLVHRPREDDRLTAVIKLDFIPAVASNTRNPEGCQMVAVPSPHLSAIALATADRMGRR